MTQLGYALNTFYLLVSAALVMWMAAGFTMLEAGSIRKKDVAEVVTKNLGLYSIACLMYLFCGFSIMYPGENAISAVVPHLGTTLGLNAQAMFFNQDPGFSKGADFLFQAVFVATTMSIISGAVAGRMKLFPFFVLSIFVTGLIYPIEGYWKWGGGFLDKMGYVDFAGSSIVHLCGASAALATILLLGPRHGKYDDGSGHAKPMPPSSIPLVALGGFILWFGWFGFNGGSQLLISDAKNAGIVSLIFVNTNAAAVAGVIGAILCCKLNTGRIDVTMVVNGAIAGLVAITASPDTPSVGVATLIGFISSIIVYYSILFFERVAKVDDPVGAISSHGAAGIFGILVVPFSAQGAHFGTQLFGLFCIFIWTFVTVFIVVGIIKVLVGLRPTIEEEELGLDALECGMKAYPEFGNESY